MRQPAKTEDGTASRAFAVVCDHNYFPGLRGLLNSILTYHGLELPVFILDHGMTDEQRQYLRTHPLRPQVGSTEILPVLPAGTWEAKQQVPAWLLPAVRCLYLLDADLVLTSRVDDVFTMAEEGRIVSSTDGEGVAYEEEYAVYSPCLPGRREPYFNTGALCMDIRRHWDLTALWAFSSNYGRYSPNGGAPLAFPGHGDQGLFNAAAHMLGKGDFFHALSEAEWCGSTNECPLQITDRDSDGRLTVTNLVTGGLQRLAHCTGAKWWTADGEHRQKGLGDKFAIFHHFETLDSIAVGRP
jgi:hypothetical protein